MHLRQCLFIAVITHWLTAFANAGERAPAQSVAELQQQLSNHLVQPKFAASVWGVKIVSLETGNTLFEHNAQKLLSPASNSKLYTVALALHRLGPDYRIRTSLYSTTHPSRRGTLNGDLIVFGRGDPAINARLHNGDIHAALDPLAEALAKAGVKRVTGDLVADESYFHGSPYGSGWAWDDMEYYYGAEISALTINDNTLQLQINPGPRIGEPCKLVLSPPTTFVSLINQTSTGPPKTKRSIKLYRPLEQNLTYVTGQSPVDEPGYTDEVTVHSPATLFGSVLKETLARRRIRISGTVRTVSSTEFEKPARRYENLYELGGMDSPPLKDIAREIMKPSQNLYTDLLLAHVGEKTRAADTPASTTSEDLGIAELNRFLAEAGIKSGDVFFEEGSGLSRNNLATPNATIALLQFMSKHSAADDFLNALPIAGVDGTLRNRMKNTAAAGNVRAKTGTLRWANCLSGYVQSAAGERLAFSIMLNRYYNEDPTHSSRDEVDAIAIMLAEFTGRSGD